MLADRVVSPDALHHVSSLPVRDGICHAGAYRDDGRCVVETAEAPWAYAVSWPVHLRSALPGKPHLLEIAAQARQGRFGVLAAGEDGASLGEVFFSAEEGPQTKYLPVGPQVRDIVVRNGALAGPAVADIASIEVFDGFDGRFRADPNYDLRSVTRAAGFRAQAKREKRFTFGSLATTEACNLGCAMCHFNGPRALKRGRRLEPEQVETILDQLQAGEEVWFAATGEFFYDPHAMDHLRAAASRNLRISVLSHGQFYTPELLDELLAIGVRTFRMSADSIDHAQFRKIRRGGELQKILDTCTYLRSRKADYPGLSVEVTCTLLSNTFGRQAEFEAFWSDKVDKLLFNAEYFDTFHFRNLLDQPPKRVNCEVKTYVMPSGHIVPCCAIMVDQHKGGSDWLPHISTHSLQEAYDVLNDMYEDPTSELSRRCRQCEWWIMWAGSERDNGSAYFRWVDFRAA